MQPRHAWVGTGQQALCSHQPQQLPPYFAATWLSIVLRQAATFTAHCMALTHAAVLGNAHVQALRLHALQAS